MHMSKERMYSETVNHYQELYHVGYELCSEAIRHWGDSKRTHRFLEFVKNVKENCPTYDKSFDDIVRDYNISQAVDA